jgi:hypothetical protein
VSEDEALSRLRHLDREQAEYLKHAYQIDWLSPDLYRLILNIDDVSDDDAANLVVQVASASGATPGGTRRPSTFLQMDPRHRTAPRLSLA